MWDGGDMQRPKARMGSKYVRGERLTFAKFYAIWWRFADSLLCGFNQLVTFWEKGFFVICPKISRQTSWFVFIESLCWLTVLMRFIREKTFVVIIFYSQGLHVVSVSILYLSFLLAICTSYTRERKCFYIKELLLVAELHCRECRFPSFTRKKEMWNKECLWSCLIDRFDIVFTVQCYGKEPSDNCLLKPPQRLFYNYRSKTESSSSFEYIFKVLTWPWPDNSSH